MKGIVFNLFEEVVRRERGEDGGDAFLLTRCVIDVRLSPEGAAS